MKIIGLTGGIGSGKTTCAQIFRCLGIHIYNSDIEAKRIMNENENVRSSITKLFGSRSYYKKKGINRKYIASRVFRNKRLLTKLNEIVHPAVRANFMQWGQERINHPYIIQESAILFETGSYKLFDFVILVDAPEELRIQRVVERDSATREEILQRMDNQWTSEKKRTLADYIIENDGKKSLIHQILHIHHKILDR